MKILIIGAKGMLGQDLAKVFSSHELVLWDKDEIDITFEDQVLNKIKEEKPDVIINSAAYNDVDGCEENFELANKVNGYAVGYLAKAAKEVNAVLVHYSTDYVFEGTKEKGYKEDDQPNPQSKYAESKYLGEQELAKNTDKFYLIRTSRLFGKPAMAMGAKKSFVDKMLELSKNRDTLEVVDEEYSNPTYTPDLAKQTKYIIENKVSFGIYHAIDEGACTWYTFVQEIFKIKNIDAELVPVSSDKFPRPAKRPAYSSLINTKLPKMRSWQEALEEYLK